jgi:hypothetical protein
MIAAEINISYDRYLKHPETDDIITIIQAGYRIIEKAYVKESPWNIGDLAGEVKVQNTPTGFVVTTTATTDDGEPYPLYLHEGTGALEDAPDFGYTTGRVRAGEVLKGIGGIRPNKFATRAAEKSEDDFLTFVEEKIDILINAK